MKVLHIVESLSPEWGGLSRAVAGLAAAMAHMRLEVEIITTVQGDEEYFHPEGTKIGMFRRGPLRWWGYAPHLAPAIKKAVRRVDLVHIHGLWLYPHLVASRAALRACTPYIVSPHGMLDLWAFNHKKFRKRIYAGLIDRRTLMRAAAVHAVSDHEVIDTKRLRLTRPVFIVPNGIDTCEFDNLPDQSTLSLRYPTLAGKTVLLFLGRIHPIKGLDIMTKAFCKLASKRDNVILLIAGPDEIGYRAKLESCLEAGGAKGRYLFTGMLRGEERLAALAAADIFILPSYSEGFSVAVLEALAAGLPVILSKAANVPGVEDTGAGLVVASEPDSLYEGILRLIDDPVLREQMSRKGRQLVLANYTWDKVAARMIEVYEMVLAGSKV